MPSSSPKNNERLIFWGSIALAAVVCLVVVPLFPLFWDDVYSLLDVRNWSQMTWFVANVVVLAVLVSIRFGPDLKRAWLARKQRK